MLVWYGVSLDRIVYYHYITQRSSLTEIAEATLSLLSPREIITQHDYRIAPGLLDGIILIVKNKFNSTMATCEATYVLERWRDWAAGGQVQQVVSLMKLTIPSRESLTGECRSPSKVLRWTGSVTTVPAAATVVPVVFRRAGVAPNRTNCLE